MIFYRFGDIPEDECSSIWNNNDEVIGKEKGVSVYEAHKNINGVYSPVIPFPTNEKAFNDFILLMSLLRRKSMMFQVLKKNEHE